MKTRSAPAGKVRNTRSSGRNPANHQILVQLAAAEAGVGAMVLPRLRHRFSRPSRMVPLDIDLGPFARGALHLVAARSALDIPRIRLLAQLIETELSRVVRT